MSRIEAMVTYEGPEGPRLAIGTPLEDNDVPDICALLDANVYEGDERISGPTTVAIPLHRIYDIETHEVSS